MKRGFGVETGIFRINVPLLIIYTIDLSFCVCVCEHVCVLKQMLTSLHYIRMKRLVLKINLRIRIFFFFKCACVGSFFLNKILL